MVVFVGDDWAEAHHDVHVMNEAGEQLASRRFPEGLSGIAGLHELLAGFVDDPGEVIVGIETDRGLWVQALLAAGYRVFAVNPLSVARYRDRHSVSGAKSDAGDAKLLADLVRTDSHNHRLVTENSEQASGLQVMARAHQNLIWDRVRHVNRLRNALREFFPAALVAFDDLAHFDAVGVLQRAPSPEAASQLTIAQIRAAMRRGGRKRGFDDRAREIRAALRTEHLQASPAVARGFAASVSALVAVIGGLNTAIADLEDQIDESFRAHPDADIYLSLPGLGVTLGARMLGEFGDAPNRYTSAKSRRNYAGTSPLTVASGKKHMVRARHIRIQRLYDAVHTWALCSIQRSPGCKQFYQQRRDLGDTHNQAIRALGNRLVGYLHGCLKSRQHYDEHTAWAHRKTNKIEQAA